MVNQGTFIRNNSNDVNDSGNDLIEDDGTEWL
jgi:hypothetical protein